MGFFEKPDKETLNHKFKQTGDYTFTSEPVTEKELAEMRKDFDEGNYSPLPIGRSCWVCNSAHVRLIDWPAMNCFSCGRVYHKGVDITDYSGSELEEFTHIDENKVTKIQEEG